jgi:hypothetical protein
MKRSDRRLATLPVLALAAGGLGLLALAGCSHPGGEQKANVVSCQSRDADRPVCIEYEPFDDDMRLVAVTQCREAGGTPGSSCPTEGLVGICDRPVVTDDKDRKPWEFSRRNRTHHYAVTGAVSGPPDAAKLEADCTAQRPRVIPGVWTAPAGSQ